MLFVMCLWALQALDRFKADEQAVLVATDVAARGLDIRDVRCVTVYGM
jgi:superfamily II DNA/RNA helicase